MADFIKTLDTKIISANAELTKVDAITSAVEYPDHISAGTTHEQSGFWRESLLDINPISDAAVNKYLIAKSQIGEFCHKIFRISEFAVDLIFSKRKIHDNMQFDFHCQTPYIIDCNGKTIPLG